MGAPGRSDGCDGRARAAGPTKMAGSGVGPYYPHTASSNDDLGADAAGFLISRLGGVVEVFRE